MRAQIDRRIAALLLIFACGQVVAAPLEDGTAAFEAGRYVEAKSILEPLAANGVSAAKRMLGEMYYGGKGVTQSKAAAIKWTASAAADGDRLAEFSMGYLYENGDGVAKSDKKAIEFYRQSAMQRYVPAMVKLADLLQYSDPQGAKYWYQTASEYGDEYSRNKYARIGEAESNAAYAQRQKSESERKSECSDACPINAERERCELKMMEPTMCSTNTSPPVEIEVNVSTNNPGIDPRVFRGVPNINPRTFGASHGNATVPVTTNTLSTRSTQTTANVQGAKKDLQRSSAASQSQPESAPSQSNFPGTNAASKSANSASERFICNKHEIFREISGARLTEEQACSRARDYASGFISGFGKDTIVGQDTRKLLSIESCKVSGDKGASFKSAEVRVNYSEVNLNPCGSAGKGMAR
ncbi:tetratricopeptide repeat protein [Herbaspirillum frisingense]|uniref:tetratricopeptide repeat protein n=1 Tax=Herbaspirillum frisingense TaxID=92645 RepID=UPI001F1682D7|nr:tetratricopeptide repeat protein [Herbaspirillum frisingense]UIN20317.1 sel1 repeat family protein [Herbaspirillum frisingense]